MTLGDGLLAYLSMAPSVGDRVHPLTLPQGAVLPAVVYQLIDGEGPLHSHADAHNGTSPPTSRCQRSRSSWAAGRTVPEGRASRRGGRAIALVKLALDDCRPDVGRYRWVVDVIVHWIDAG